MSENKRIVAVECQHYVFIPINVKERQPVNARVEDTADDYFCFGRYFSYLLYGTACYLVPRICEICACDFV